MLVGVAPSRISLTGVAAFEVQSTRAVSQTAAPTQTTFPQVRALPRAYFRRVMSCFSAYNYSIIYPPSPKQTLF